MAKHISKGLFLSSHVDVVIQTLVILFLLGQHDLIADICSTLVLNNIEVVESHLELGYPFIVRPIV